MDHLAVTTLSGLLVGGLLGALGAGGSVVTVPVLVYVLGESVGTAAVTSLLIVAVTAASGAIAHGRAGTVRFRTALTLSAVSAAGSWPGSLLRTRVGGRSYLLAFALLLALASILVWRRPTEARGLSARECVIEPLPPIVRASTHAAAEVALAPGGLVIVEAFSPRQMSYSSGGPRDVAMLYEVATLRADFPHIAWDVLEETEVDLDEGPLHRGRAAVVRGVGRMS